MDAKADRLAKDVSPDTTSLDAPVRLDVWADIACPWCYLGHARLDVVLEDARPPGRRSSCGTARSS